MQPKLKKFIKDQDLDALLFIGDSFCESDMYYLSRFFSFDRFAILASDKIVLLVSSLEQGRAVLESCADVVASTSEYGIHEKLKASERPEEAYLLALLEFLRDQEVSRIGVPRRFPAGFFYSLSKEFSIRIVESPVSNWREIKCQEEIDAIRSVQRSCELAMRSAVKLISKSKIINEKLYLGGKPLTSEKVRGAIEVALLREGCEAVDTIVAGGASAANPHARGSGALPAGGPIVIDIFPRSRSTRYFADMTRTVTKGEPDLKLIEIYQAVLEAQTAALSMLQAGADGREVHAKVCQVFDNYGFYERDKSGFIHSTGHGIGLEIHELPSISEAGSILKSGSVVTVEPGLYYPDIGGVRLEDLAVIRKGGCENLTEFEKRFVL